MAAAVDSMMIDPGPEVYYTDAFRNVLEDHLTYLRTSTTSSVIIITPMEAHRYEMDLHGLLATKNIPRYLHWLIMRMNFMNSPTEVKETLSQMIIPDPKEVARILQAFNSTRVS